MTGHGAPGRFDLAGCNPFRLQCLQTKLAEIKHEATLGVSVNTAFMGLPELGAFRL